MASSTASPPRMPVSQSWTTATRPKDEGCELVDDDAVSATSLPPAGILLPSAFRFRLRRRLQRVLVGLSALVADVVILQELLGRHFGQTANAVVLPGALIELLRLSIVVHAVEMIRDVSRSLRSAVTALPLPAAPGLRRRRRRFLPSLAGSPFAAWRSAGGYNRGRLCGRWSRDRRCRGS